MRLPIAISILVITLSRLQSGAAQAGSAGIETPKDSPAPAVALIAGPGLDPMISLLEVRLSEGNRLRLVERRELDRVLQEHRLTAAGLVDRQTVARTGRLLRADAMVLLTLEDAAPQPGSSRGRLVRVRVAETAHGLRLWESYEALETPQAEAAAARIAERVLAAMEKVARPGGSAVPVGIVGIHRMGLDERYELLVGMLPKLLSARLGREPEIVVLEREDLAVLLKEKQLAEGEDSKFWDSGILIDGRLQRSDGGLQMTLRWRRAEGEGQGSIVTPVDPNAPVRAVDAAAVELLKTATNTSPGTPWEPQKEAEEFFRQGMLLRTHGRHETAFGPLETAYALRPETTSYVGALFENEWELRGYAFAAFYINPTNRTHYTDEQLAEWVSLLVRSVRRDWESGSLSAGDFLEQRNRPAWIRSGQWSYFAHRASVSSPSIRALNRENRRIWCKATEQAMESRPAENQFRIGDLDGRAALPWIRSDDPQEVMADVRKAYGRLILPPAQGGTISSADVRSNACKRCLLEGSQSLSDWALRDSHFCGCEAQIKALWLGYVGELSRCEDPIVRFYAHAARAEIVSYDLPSAQTSIEFWWKAVKVLTEELHGPSSPLGDLAKRRLCEPLKDIAWRPLQHDIPGLVTTWERVFEPLISNGNAMALAWWDPGDKCIPLDSDEIPRDAARRFHNLLIRVEAILETGRDKPVVSHTLGRVRSSRVDLESQYGLSAPAKSPSDVDVALLLKKTGPSAQPLSGPYRVYWQLSGETLHLAVAIERGQPTLARIDLTGRTPARRIQAGVSINWTNLAGLAATDDAVYVAVRDVGVVVLPNDAWNGQDAAYKPRVLTQEHGLPSVSITGMAGDHSRLWIAYGRPDAESGLGLCDPRTGTWETVLCSTLKGEEPFNAGRPYALMYLVTTRTNDLYFINFARLFRDMVPWMGLWRLDTTTRNLTYLGCCGAEQSIQDHLDGAGGDCWCRGNSSLVRVDAESREATYLLGFRWRPSSRQTTETTRWLESRNELFLPEDSMAAVPFRPRDRGGLDLAASAIHGDELWTLLGNTQIAVLHRGRPFAEARILANNLLDGEPVLQFLSTPYGLVAVGDGAVGLVKSQDSPRASP